MAETKELDLYKNYDEIRDRYLMRTREPLSVDSRMNQPEFMSDPHGYFREDPFFRTLSERHAGFDKLFLTLVQGVVDDPDYALRKDSRVYERMRRDPQIYYCLEVRKSATASLKYQLVPPEGHETNPQAVELASQAEKRFRKIGKWRKLVGNLLNALLPGLSIVECCWDVDEATGEYYVDKHFPVNKDRFKFDALGKLRLKSRQAPTYGMPVPDYKYIAHTFDNLDGSWDKPEDAGYVFYGLGLADTPLYHYFYFKITALRLWLKSLERNASPFKIYYTGAQNAALTSKLDSIFSALQNDSVVGIPGKKGETNVDVITATGRSELFMALIEYIDRLITRAILGQELMTQMPEVGSYAAAQVHASVFAKIVEGDRELLEDTINNSLIAYDHALNIPHISKEFSPQFKFKTDALVDASSFLSVAQQASSMGLTLSEEQLRENTGLREPREGERPVLPMAMQQMQMQMQMQQLTGMNGQPEGEPEPEPEEEKPQHNSIIVPSMTLKGLMPYATRRPY